MCDTNPAALLRAQNTCVYVSSHLIHPQQNCTSNRPHVSTTPTMVFSCSDCHAVGASLACQGSSKGNSMFSVFEILQWRKAFPLSDNSMRWFPGLLLSPSRACRQTPGCGHWWVGARKSSRRCPSANSCPTSLLFTFGPCFVTFFRLIKRTPIRSVRGPRDKKNEKMEMRGSRKVRRREVTCRQERKRTSHGKEPRIFEENSQGGDSRTP